MGKSSGRWMGIGCAVLVAGALALYVSGSRSHPTPETSASPGLAPARTDQARSGQTMPGMSAEELVGLALKLGIVAGLLGGSLWLLRRYAGPALRAGGRTGAITIADTITLAQGRALYVVDIGDRALVVGATPQQLSLLAEVTDAATLDQLRARPERPPAPWSDLSQRLHATLRAAQRPKTAGQRSGRVASTFAETLALSAAVEQPPAGDAAPIGDASARLQELAARVRAARRVA